jgi:hypothetical protein
MYIEISRITTVIEFVTTTILQYMLEKTMMKMKSTHIKYLNQTCQGPSRHTVYFQRSEVKTALVRSQVRRWGRYSPSCVHSLHVHPKVRRSSMRPDLAVGRC